MATNKHAVIRYQTLDKCFRNPGKRYYVADLVEACSLAIYNYSGRNIGIRRRQVLEDIKFMESPQGWNFPLERIRDGRSVYFRYSNLNYSINNEPLNDSEKNQLKEALLTLSRFKGLPQFEWVEEILARLDSGLDLSSQNQRIIQFDQNNYLKGLDFFLPIYQAILYKKSLLVEYQNFKQEDSQNILLHPYFLKQYNNRWYIFGQQEGNINVLNLALDRIKSLAESSQPYLLNDTVNFEEYFEDIVGVTVNQGRELKKITLRISNDLYPYILTKPIHGSQKSINQNKEFAYISLELIPNYELESLILSFSEGLKVMEPIELREKIHHRIKKMKLNYE